MRKLILRILVTLDGVAAGETGQIDGVDYGDEGSWRDIFATLERVDTLLVGSAGYKEYFEYWKSVLSNPAAKPNERKFAEYDARTPHFVLSRTLKSVEYPNAKVLPGGLDGLNELKRQSGRDILLWGGPTVAGAAIESDLVDELHLETHPVIAGQGKKLFANVPGMHRLRHQNTETYPSGVVILKYARASAP